MILLSLEIAHYGKMKNRTIELRPGTNVITGDNETGKTTIASFIKSMLYGLDPAEEDYTHFLPREADGVFGGAVTFENHDHVYRVERSFLKGQTTVKLVDETLGSSLSEPDEKLKRMLAGLSKETFEATAFARQESYQADEAVYRETPERRKKAALEASVREAFQAGKERLQALREEKVRSRDLSIASRKAKNEVFAAENAKKIFETEAELKETSDRESKERVRLSEDAMEAANKNKNREEDFRKRKEDAEKAWDTFRTEEEAKAAKSNVSGTILLILGVLGGLAAAYFIVSHRIYNTGHDLFYIAVIAAAAVLALLVLGVVFTVRTFRIRKKAKRDLESETTLSGAAADTAEALENYLNNRAAYDDFVENKEAREEAVRQDAERKEQLSETLSALRRDKESLDAECRLLTEAAAKDDTLQKEIRAIEIAMASFDRLGNLNEAEGVTELTVRAGEYFDRFVPKRGAELLDDYGIGMLKVNGSQYLFNQLSTGTCHAVLLALRLARLDELDPDRRVPVILDDVFTHFDASRSESVIDVFRQSGRQVIMLTCHAGRIR